MFFGKTGFINGVKALQSQRGFKDSSNWKELLKRVEINANFENQIDLFYYFIIIIII